MMGKISSVKIAESPVFPIVTNGRKRWTMNKDRKKLDVFEIWVWRKILSLSWGKKRKTTQKVSQTFR